MIDWSEPLVNAKVALRDAEKELALGHYVVGRTLLNTALAELADAVHALDAQRKADK